MNRPRSERSRVTTPAQDPCHQSERQVSELFASNQNHIGKPVRREGQNNKPNYVFITDRLACYGLITKYRG
ncbi:hypothetical protein PoB_000273200 [Plakobranchus ocellatus]|uniref:Uncharacterized protein n=1 Tax=Plakobranchus ocellatus TaxID=259542 RepID=A0AAV3Y1A8_9GAST|nr:hypothetical protein PoB_000273200 [Plakobranchus ocellatus]